MAVMPSAIDTREDSGYGGAYGPPRLTSVPRTFVVTGVLAGFDPVERQHHIHLPQQSSIGKGGGGRGNRVGKIWIYRINKRTSPRESRRCLTKGNSAKPAVCPPEEA